MLCDYCIAGNVGLGYVSNNNQTGIIKYYCMDEFGESKDVLLENYATFELMTADQIGNVCIVVTDSQNNSYHLLIIDSLLKNFLHLLTN